MRRRALLAAAALAAFAGPAAAVAAESDKRKKKSGGVSYLPIETLTGATNRSGGRRGVLTVECGLDVPDAGLRARADESMPRLRAAYLETVITYAAGLPEGATPNADFLARAMQRQTDALLGRPGARLLLGAILVN
ncbi:MAG TPA: Tat pathway signal protein [Phenylobacterium sp.]|uniref:Tat pathway signal protein n=1 Tax=Phenylobacterium sp. TaxID=1871053 RepID=UPI002BB3E397|nr:Tat pathway signal protein [Phenylobacterium sp.]HSV02682.1 Tat pathway signal protein [Phenylobacterium sp.]